MSLIKAALIGPRTEEMALALFARLGRPGQRALYGLTNLPRTCSCAAIEEICARFLEAGCGSYKAVRHALERQAARTPTPVPALIQEGAAIRSIAEYQSFWEDHAQSHTSTEDADAHVTY
ncbi:MAG: hypothetical protein IPK72_05265 [Candidatus Eisenbacteria bacterium]|nr:hypothetical protein [Candidatus Eisenbacteria bacterium]